jgi:dihydrofolate synthase/folylpolyglutamate synthase
VNFAESEAYLYSLGNEVETMKLGLDNIRKLLTALDNPEKKYLKVQVAGTNGKGSVCAFLNSICLEAGIKTGLYTSPHLVSMTERVKIGGNDISQEHFAEFASRVRSESERLVDTGVLENVPTFFEQITAMALVAFAEANVELAILETGLGGRFDAVTAASAEMCAITRIDLDHQRYLGETLEEIAAEKAAIIRESSHVVIGKQSPIALKVILGHCESLGVTTNDEIYRPWKVVRNSDDSVSVETTKYTFPHVVLVLEGEHQVENAETALNIAQGLEYQFRFEIEDGECIVRGLQNARHPGRLEWIGNVLLDGAHNQGGARALAAYLDEFVECPITLVFGAMGDKNVAEIAEILWPRAHRVILTSPQNVRALTADELADMKPNEIDSARITKTNSVSEAMGIAISNARSDETILVTGSLYLVGEARKLLTREAK